MKVTVVGTTEFIKGISKKTNRPYHMMFMSAIYEEKGTLGHKAETFAIQHELCVESEYIPVVGDEVNLIYGRGGFLERIEPARKE